MNFWTLYWPNGKKQFIAGPTRERAYRDAGIDLSTTLNIEHVAEGFDFSRYWKDSPPQWYKNKHPVGQVDVQHLVVNGQRFRPQDYEQTNELLKQAGVVVRRYDYRLMVATHDLARIWRLKLASKEPA